MVFQTCKQLLKSIANFEFTIESKRAESLSKTKVDLSLEQNSCTSASCFSHLPNGDYYLHKASSRSNGPSNHSVKNDNSRSGYIPPDDWSYDEIVCST